MAWLKRRLDGLRLSLRLWHAVMAARWDQRAPTANPSPQPSRHSSSRSTSGATSSTTAAMSDDRIALGTCDRHTGVATAHYLWSRGAGLLAFCRHCHVKNGTALTNAGWELDYINLGGHAPLTAGAER